MGGGDGGARAHPAGSRGDGVATRRWSGKRRWGWSLESKRGKRSEREVEGTVARVVGAKRERVGSSHADRNGPTEFYPTIREARRGSGPRPTAATARSARAASVFLPSLGDSSLRRKGGITVVGSERKSRPSFNPCPPTVDAIRPDFAAFRVVELVNSPFSLGEERAIRIARRSFSIREVVGNDNRRRKSLEGGDLC